MKIGKLLLAGLAVTAAGMLTARASISLDYVNFGPYETVNATITHGATTETINGVVAGFYNIRLDSGPIIKTFCIDIADDSMDDANAELVSLAAAPDSWAGPMGDTAANTIKKLWAKYYTDALGNQTKAAALQVAIWQAIDQAMSTYSVVFSGNNTVTSLAGDMLTAVTTDPNAKLADLGAITSLIGQDFIVPVPEPATVIAGALLLLPFAAGTIRRFSKN